MKVYPIADLVSLPVGADKSILAFLVPRARTEGAQVEGFMKLIKELNEAMLAEEREKVKRRLGTPTAA